LIQLYFPIYPFPMMLPSRICLLLPLATLVRAQNAEPEAWAEATVTFKEVDVSIKRKLIGLCLPELGVMVDL
jgi:hypothetical protein